ncbi:MAG TPA: 16S rRNA (cytosine(967)-C(5))-methyltransferase RsmB [Kiloniellales bacterium]|nr:16S rRNA (cytosine(967)-C(5))-methyltransferase RsmB [Kiloniellales bacterium]
MSSPDPRRISLDILHAVLRRRQPLDDAFNSHTRLNELSARDRAFARLLATTVIRRLGEIDTVLATFLDKPLRGKRDAVQDVLRLGAGQLLFLEIPPHAAVATSVALAKAVGFEALAGLVNAVLRRLASEGQDRLSALDPDPLTLPQWLWKRFVRTYGETQTREITRIQRTDPPLDLTLRDPDRAEHWAEQLNAIRLPNGSLRLSSGTGDVRRLPGFTEGAWWIQDTAASLPARLLAPRPGEAIADLCSAPGGKALQLAAGGAEVFAVELHPKRLKLVQENLVRTQLGAACVAADAASWQAPRQLDAVLLDAPCSATGTLRRHPDVALHRRPDELEGLLKLQDRLLQNAVALLRPGGRLVYSVCSLLPEEGPARIQALLDKSAPLEIEPASPHDFGLPAEAAEETGGLRTLPSFWGDRGGMDGFYMCRLRRL